MTRNGGFPSATTASSLNCFYWKGHKRLKVRAFVRNARAFLDLVKVEGSFSSWLWSFAPRIPDGGRSRRRLLPELPAQTPESAAMSAALKKRGFTFVGPTITYAFMQAAGLVDDHLEGCFRSPG